VKEISPVDGALTTGSVWSCLLLFAVHPQGPGCS